MKFTEQTSLDPLQNSLKEKRFMKWNQFWNTEGKDEDINTFWNGKDIPLPMQHGNQNRPSLMTAICWLPTRTTVNSDDDLDYLLKQDGPWVYATSPSAARLHFWSVPWHEPLSIKLSLLWRTEPTISLLFHNSPYHGSTKSGNPNLHHSAFRPPFWSICSHLCRAYPPVW